MVPWDRGRCKMAKGMRALARLSWRWLTGSPKRSQRRKLAARCLWRLRALMLRFYTVQDPTDIVRLRSTGYPWPSEPNRAHLGTGVYAWQHRSEADKYLAQLARHVPNLEVVAFRVPSFLLAMLPQLDVDKLHHPGEWMKRHSRLWNGLSEPHRFLYIRRGTGIGFVEHYFHSSVFWLLWFR